MGQKYSGTRRVPVLGRTVEAGHASGYTPEQPPLLTPGDLNRAVKPLTSLIAPRPNPALELRDYFN